MKDTVDPPLPVDPCEARTLQVMEAQRKIVEILFALPPESRRLAALGSLSWVEPNLIIEVIDR